MKIIHCADLHLDSKMNTHLSREKAKERKNEILNTFSRMVEYASDNGVSAILIAGDLFDTDKVTQTTQNVVISEIRSHEDINFYYLRGNHDATNFLSSIEEPLSNLFFFSEDSWTSYSLGEEAKITISGIELTRDNATIVYSTLMPDKNKFNIVMLHGQEAISSSEKNEELVLIRELRNIGIDYLALGHIHSYKEEQLDARGFYCYSGCLEGRGFDELGEHGFVLLDIDEASGTYTRSFIPFAYRKLYACEIDVSGCTTSPEITSLVDEVIDNTDILSNSLVKIVLNGQISAEAEIDLDYIKTRYESRFYFVRVVDNTILAIDYDNYAFDQSLRGEFVRTVQASQEISDEEKIEIIRYGLQAIAKEEIRI